MNKIKNILSIFLVLGFLVGAPISVSAAGVTTSVSSPGTIAPGESFTVRFTLNASETIRGYTARINYPGDLLTITSVSKNNNNFNEATGAFSSQDVVSGSKQFLAITFKPTSSFTAGKKATVSLSNFVASNDAATERLYAADKSTTITAVAPKSGNNNLSSLTVDGASVPGFSASKTAYNLGSTDKDSINVQASAQDSSASISGRGNIKLAYGSNTIRIVSKAENGAAKTYTITISKNDYRSTNNFLSSLKVSSGTIQFDKNRTSYTMIVDHDVTSLTIDVEKEDPKASIKNSSITKELAIYSNVFEFEVVAENNAKRTYSVNVVRRDADGYAGSLNTNNNLSALTIEGYDLAFNPETLEYQLNVDHLVSSLVVSATLADETASLVQPDSFDLALGPNVFEFNVIAQDETPKKYTLTVNRARNLPALSIEELLSQIDTIEADVLNVALDMTTPLDGESLNKLKATGKDVAFYVQDEEKNTIGYWRLKSDQLQLINTFNPNVRLLDKIPQSLNEQLNYAQAIVINFDHDGKFEQPLNFVLPLQDTMDESYRLNVYYFNEETKKLELVASDLEIINDEVMWALDHASIYVITPAVFASGFSFDSLFNGSGWALLVVLMLLTLSLLGNLLLLVKVKKLSKRLFARKFKENENKSLSQSEPLRSINKKVDQEHVLDNDKITPLDANEATDKEVHEKKEK